MGVYEIGHGKKPRPVPPPPPVTYPASYFTGPLGVNNIVPADPSSPLFALWFGDATLGGPVGTRSALLTRISEIGRTPHLVGCQIDQLTTGGVNSEVWIHNTVGSIPVINWNPNDTIANINTGTMDATWVTLANRLKLSTSGVPRMLFRAFIEYNNPGIPYYMGTTQADANNFALAWKRMVDIFQSNGATNIGFVICPNENAGDTGGGFDRTQENRVVAAIGESYLDWVATDNYNHDGTSYSTPAHGGWAEWNEMFNYSHTAYTHPPFWFEWGGSKPFMVAETGTKYDTVNIPAGHSVDPNRKANWYRNIATSGLPGIGNSLINGVRAIMFFDQWVTGTEFADWRVDHNQPSGSTSYGSFDNTTYQGFKDMVANSIWSGGVLNGPF